jgi:hypothetical protein
LPPLVRRALRARRPFPSKRVLARRAADRGIDPRTPNGRGPPRCGRAEGKGSGATPAIEYYEHSMVEEV